MKPEPQWCGVEQHYKWCSHNGGVYSEENGWGPPTARAPYKAPALRSFSIERPRRCGICDASLPVVGRFPTRRLVCDTCVRPAWPVPPRSPTIWHQEAAKIGGPVHAQRGGLALHVIDRRAICGKATGVVGDESSATCMECAACARTKHHSLAWLAGLMAARLHRVVWARSITDVILADAVANLSDPCQPARCLCTLIPITEEPHA